MATATLAMDSAAAAAGALVLAGLAAWGWHRRDHPGWASRAQLRRELSVQALHRAVREIRPSRSQTGKG